MVDLVSINLKKGTLGRLRLLELYGRFCINTAFFFFFFLPVSILPVGEFGRKKKKRKCHGSMAFGNALHCVYIHAWIHNHDLMLTGRHQSEGTKFCIEIM